MPNPTSPIPLDLSGHRGLPPSEIAPLLEKIADAPEEEALSALTALLMINRFLVLPAGGRLKESQPEAFGGWMILGELLSGAGRSSSRAAVPSTLRGTRGLEVLQLLASGKRPYLRSEIKQRLRFEKESDLLHLLRDLEEADLILRYRPEGGQEVIIELGGVGREIMEPDALSPGENDSAATSPAPPGAAFE